VRTFRPPSISCITSITLSPASTMLALVFALIIAISAVSGFQMMRFSLRANRLKFDQMQSTCFILPRAALNCSVLMQYCTALIHSGSMLLRAATFCYCSSLHHHCPFYCSLFHTLHTAP
jgi:hypothetical protein